MRVKVRQVGEALHPSEVVVQVKTADGAENLAVDKRSLGKDSTLSVGAPLGQNGDLWLIELPRETMRGGWRVWVKGSALVGEPDEARVA